MHEDQILFEGEEETKRADAQAIFALLSGKLLHVATQIDLQGVELLANALTLLLRQCAQVPQRLVADLQPVTHACFNDIGITYCPATISVDRPAIVTDFATRFACIALLLAITALGIVPGRLMELIASSLSTVEVALR